MGIKAEDYLSYDDPLPERLGGTEWEIDLHGHGYRDLRHYFTENALIAAGYRYVASYRKGGTFDRNLQEAWLHTGDRLYIDNNLWELSLAERLGLEAMVAADSNATAKVADILEAGGERHDGLYRRCGNGFGAHETNGYHVNMLIPTAAVGSEVDGQKVGYFLASGQSSRTWSWNGTISDTGYYRSQKAHGIGTVFGYIKTNALTNGKKQMLVLHKGDNIDSCNHYPQYTRYEDRTNSPPLTPFASFMTIGANTLLARMIEHPQLTADDLPAMTFTDPVDVLHGISTDLTMRRTYRTMADQYITAADHQHMIAVRLMQLCTELKLPAAEVRAANRLVTLADAMKRDEEQGHPGNLRRFPVATDWKLALLRKKAGDAPVLSTTEGLIEADIQFDRVLPVGTKTGSQILRNPKLDIHSQALISPEVIAAEAANAPANTRAAARADYVERHQGEHGFIKWCYASSLDMKLQERWDDPFSTEPTELSA